MNSQLVTEAVDSLLATSQPDTQRRVLLQYVDELSSMEALDLVHRAELAAPDEHSRERATKAVQLIEQVQRDGLARVLAELVPIPPAIVRSIGSYVGAPQWHERFAILIDQADLLTAPEADISLENLTAQHRLDEHAETLVAARELVRLASVEGIEAARNWLVGQLLKYIPDSSAPLNLRTSAACSVVVLDSQLAYELGILSYLVPLVRDHDDPAIALDFVISILRDEVPPSISQKSPSAWIEVHLALGELYLDRTRGDVTHNATLAVGALREALRVSESTADASGSARAKDLLGLAFTRTSSDDPAFDLRTAIAYLESARVAYEALGRQEDSDDAAGSLGYCLTELARRTPDRNERKVLLERAAAPIREALDRSLESHQASRLRSILASCYDAYSEFEPAFLDISLVCLSRALRDSPANDYNSLLRRCSFARIALHKRQTDARSSLSTAIRLMDEIIPSLESFPLAERGAAFEMLGDLLLHDGEWAAAANAYEGALPVDEAAFPRAFTPLGREAWAQSATTVRAKLSYCLCRLGRIIDAVVLLEEGRTRTLLGSLELEDFVSSQALDANRDSVMQLIQQMQSVESAMRTRPATPGPPTDVELGNQLEALRSVIHALTAQNAEVATRRRSFRFDAADLRRIAPAQGALIVPIVTPIGTAVIIMVPTADYFQSDVRFIPLTTDDLATLLLMHNDVLVALRLGEAETASHLLERLGRNLHTRFMKHVKEALRTRDVPLGSLVLLASHSGLGVLPLHAASDQADPPLVEDYVLLAVPSLSLLAYCRARRIPDRKGAPLLLTVVNPTGDLPLSALEAALLIPQVTDWAHAELLGSAATVESLLTAARDLQPSHIHLACHGKFDITFPWQSGLTLADGDINAASIATSHGSQSLVTLSACETGVSDVRRAPDEFGGLPAAFIMSGALNVVSSLWPVNDQSTALLMSRFYREFRRTGHAVHALREAQLWLRSSTAADLVAWTDQPAAKLDGLTRRVLRTQRRLRRTLKRMDAASRPYENPLYWAPFVALSLEE